MTADDTQEHEATEGQECAVPCRLDADLLEHVERTAQGAPPGLFIPIHQGQVLALAREVRRLYRKIDTITAIYVAGGSHDYENCEGWDCEPCGVRDCPYGEPLHYHHDGCPSCYQDEETP